MMDQLPLDLTQARAARDEAMNACLDKAGEDWADIAFQALIEYAAENDAFLIEEMRIARNDVPAPHDNRAWGGVINRAVRRGLIVRVGYAPAKTSHCSPKPLWRRAA